MGRCNQGEVAEWLLKAWPKGSPALRSQVVDVLMSRPAWTERLVDAIQRGKITANEIDASHRDRLRRSGVNFPALGQRSAVVEQYREVVLLKGDAAKGGVLFTN